ncbi:MAG: hypothetical protein GTO14_24285 [Anaerolineales bacterium]|nr:hypothetical protein [Anaerolineales bacterium]
MTDQTVDHPAQSYLSGDKLLITRRSIRAYEGRAVTDEVLWKVFELCRFAPTSRNCQSYYFIVVRDRPSLEFLADLRGGSSAPIARAPVAVAVCVDTALTRRSKQDGSIAAYHFMLAAKLHGLGTCWIAAMDRAEVKERLGIPKDHYVATITPVGYPAEDPVPPARRDAAAMVRGLE